MKKISTIVIAIAVLLIVGGGITVISMSNYGPKFDDVRHLTQPRIVQKPSVGALVVEATGDPKTTVGPAFGMLFGAYFKIKDRPKGKKMEAPRARWPKPLETPRDQWIGIYAIPVPPSVTAPPAVKSKNGLQLELREWLYGEVAEILHAGPYSTEDTTVQRLKQFIAENGYEICGDHEEEYLKGPGILPGNPEKYLTVIRYQVRKTAANEIPYSSEGVHTDTGS